MHHLIIQITDEPIGRDWFITEEEFYDSNVGDYYHEVNEDERKDVIKRLPSFLGRLFDCDGEVLTYKGNADKILEEMINSARKMLDNMENPTSYKIAKLRNVLDFTHLDVYHMFYTEKCDSYAINFCDFLSLLTGYVAGTKFYIGGLVDFHE